MLTREKTRRYGDAEMGRGGERGRAFSVSTCRRVSGSLRQPDRLSQLRRFMGGHEPTRYQVLPIKKGQELNDTRNIDDSKEEFYQSYADGSLSLVQSTNATA